MWVERQEGTEVEGRNPEERSPGDVVAGGARGRSRRHSQPCGARGFQRSLSQAADRRLRRRHVASECGEGVLGGPTKDSLSPSESPDRPLSFLHYWTAKARRIAQKQASFCVGGSEEEESRKWSKRPGERGVYNDTGALTKGIC